MKKLFKVVSSKKTKALRAACKKAIDDNLTGEFHLLMERIDPDDGPKGSYGALFGDQTRLVLAIVTDLFADGEWHVVLDVAHRFHEDEK